MKPLLILCFGLLGFSPASLPLCAAEEGLIGHWKFDEGQGIFAQDSSGNEHHGKIENEKLDFGDYPSEELIGKLARALETDEDELLILAKKIPEQIKKRVMERPDAFRKFANLDDEKPDRLLDDIDDDA